MESEEKVKPWNKFPPFRLPTAVVSSTEENNNRRDRVAKQFWPIICILRIFGFYPISKLNTTSVEEDEEEDKNDTSSVSKILGTTKLSKCKSRKNKLYKACFWTWKAKIAIYSYFMTALNLFCWTIFICNIGLGIKIPLDLARLPEDGYHHNSTYSEAESENRLTILAEGVIKFLEMFHLIVNSELFTDWLNNWNDFEKDFRKYFGPKNISFNFDIRAFCTGFLVFYSLLPSLVRLGMGIKANLHYWHNPKYYILSYFVFFWIDILLVVHSLLEDSKTFLMLRALNMTYEQVRFAINEDVSVGRVDGGDVIQWGKITHSIRKQVTLCSEYIKGRQILILIESVFIFSGGAFSFLEFSRNSKPFSAHHYFLISNATLCVLCYIRLYVTVLLAEKIYQEEAQLAEDVLEMLTEGMNESTNKELKFLYTTLTEKPKIINLGNYINVDKKLITKMGLSIIIFLIAIMQFNSCSQV